MLNNLYLMNHPSRAADKAEKAHKYAHLSYNHFDKSRFITRQGGTDKVTQYIATKRRCAPPKMKAKLVRAVIMTVFTILFISPIYSKCVGRFVNPISDVCWSCIFPMTIGGMRVAGGEDTPNSRDFICACPRPPLPTPVPGVPVSFWEPVRLVEATRTPYCLVAMGGVQVAGNGGVRLRGSVSHKGGSSSLKHSFYQAHWYVYPLIYWLELLTDFICLEKASFDVAYLTELDPLWNDDEFSFIINPEVALFSNPLAQAACAVDCGLASAGFGNDAMFWCDGCQGSLYPFTGSVPAHVGGVQASLLIAGRLMAKLHRQLILWGFVGRQAYCDKYPMPIILKSQYKTQMVYPIPSTRNGCHPLGRSESIWASGREYPYSGEDFAYLIWRKRHCCVL